MAEIHFDAMFGGTFHDGAKQINVVANSNEQLATALREVLKRKPKSADLDTDDAVEVEVEEVVENTLVMDDVVKEAATVPCDDVIFENCVFVDKYDTVPCLRKLRTQIYACLATDDKDDVRDLVDPKSQNQLVMIYAMMVNLRMVEERRGSKINFLCQMNKFFPQLFPDPKALFSSFANEASKWSEGYAILPYGEWNKLREKMQTSKYEKFKAIAERIKPILQEAL